MIKAIIELLKATPYEELGEAGKIAKGKYKTPSGVKSLLQHCSRIVKDAQNGNS